MRRRRLSRSDEGGAVTVEFALVFPLVAMILSFLLAVGLVALWSALDDYIARDAARYATIQGTGGQYPTRADVTSHITSKLGGVLGAPASVTMSQTPTLSPAYNPDVVDTRLGEGDVVSVTVTYNVPGLTTLTGLVNAFPGLHTIDLSGIATVKHTATARRE